MLFDRIEIGHAGAPRSEMFQPRLIIRESCAIANPIMSGMLAAQ